MFLIDVLRARKRIAPYIVRTPLVRSPWLSGSAAADVWLKLESLQVSNSFKSRGAFNAVLARIEREPGARLRLVTASAGNHGRALAVAAETFGLPVTVFTPADAPLVKLAAIRRHGADLRSDARDYDDAEKRAKEFARETGAEFVSPYNDGDVIAGAATVALEILEDRPDTAALVVPVGGGGLISGVAAAAKAVDEAIDVTGVEVEASCAFQTSLRAGRLVPIVPGPTLADGLGGNPDADTITFGFIQKFVDRIVTVSERALACAIVGLVESEHVVAEGAGAAAPAAVESKKADLAGRRVVVIVSGGNIDRSKLASVIQAQ
jgi:threonine dehydratase